MTIKEALEVAEHHLDRIQEAGAKTINRSQNKKAAETLRRWQPFIEAAIAFQRRWHIEQSILTSEDLEAHRLFDETYLAAMAKEE